MSRAAEAEVPVYFVECRLGEEAARQRLIERANSGQSVSDASWETYVRMREEFHPLSDIPQGLLFQINTDSELLQGLDRLEELL